MIIADILKNLKRHIFVDLVDMEVMDELEDKLNALNQTRSDDVKQVMMDLDELELKHEQEVGKFHFNAHSKYFLIFERKKIKYKKDIL